MKMYKWDSEFLRDYSQGAIVVIAESIKMAREKVLVKFDAENKESCSYESERLELMEDIKNEPKLVEVLFINGSQ